MLLQRFVTIYQAVLYNKIIFINMFPFLHVKANAKEIMNILSFFFQKNADIGIFVEIQG